MPINQKGASREQMKDYNALAKKYNEMPSDNMRILMKDVERLKYIYSLMSDKQKADAEPFPDFPEPPATVKPTLPPPPLMDTIFTYNRLSMRIRSIARNRNANVAYLRDIYSKMSDSQKDEVTNPDKVVSEISSPKTIKGQPSAIPASPVPPSPLDHVIDMAKKGASFFYERKKISSDKAIELIKKNKSLHISTTKSSSKKPQVKISIEPIKIGSVEKKFELLDYAMELKEKHALFSMTIILLAPKKVFHSYQIKNMNRFKPYLG